MNLTLFDLIYLAFGLCIGGVIGYLRGYSKKKGENKALSEDVARLTREKHEVISQYELRLEEEKKKHTLDIEKRKYRYEEKARQFTRYFALLDEFHRKANESFEIEFKPIVDRFLENFIRSQLENDPASSSKAMAEFGTAVQATTSKLNEEHLRIRSETNTLRLVASETMRKVLDELDQSLDSSFEASMELLKTLAVPDQFKNPEVFQSLQDKNEALGRVVHEKREELMSLMRKELDEI